MSANTEAQGSGRGLEAIKWVVVAILLIGAIVGNFYYREVTLPLRALAVVVLIAAAGGIALARGLRAGASVRTAIRMPSKNFCTDFPSYTRAQGDVTP